ncbi:uncharacterized protein BDCG_17796 [Blastomyces dermatitidis ER-3]|uniref:Uncharacterized protein n=2 Tax=Ajellomyces dermatitidis TaxID=5039 RepID=A0A0J9EN54_AJEDA|nr:uncharacterized protein BDCG_17796 [Blastomyces dermatitidis ER-3]EQL37644.1 hypothetical protein BDFG_01212 [Blastomyces dermatitidis ATCC 26199]KMW66685.1 hypothetical protein BDDG_11667 [Blastomyces dermatitidis ATCC 18188]OAT02835.1 hypothetical protein BDCG_17796 [Blastomyces dermatitidis ER-3]
MTTRDETRIEFYEPSASQVEPNQDESGSWRTKSESTREKLGLVCTRSPSIGGKQNFRYLTVQYQGHLSGAKMKAL